MAGDLRRLALGLVLVAACGDSGGGEGEGSSLTSPSTSPTMATSTSPTSSSTLTTGITSTATISTGDDATNVTSDSDASTGPLGDPTCTPCEEEPCTRDCLPSLGSDGPAFPPPYSGGDCPPLAAGPIDDFGFNARDFELFIPTSTNGPYAVVFSWHGAGGDAPNHAGVLSPYYDDGGYILVVPDGQDLYDSQWRVEETPGVEGPPPQEDLNFFDDVVSCLWEQYPIDLRRVHTTGFSVGGRFSAYLMAHRSDRVGSIAAWSGGDVTPQGIVVVPAPPHQIPGLLYHGGPGDTPACCGQAATETLVATMIGNDQLTIVCDHGGGHSIPGPFDTRMGELADFFLAHPFSAGNAAQWADAGLPAGFSGDCEIR